MNKVLFLSLVAVTLSLGACGDKEDPPPPVVDPVYGAPMPAGGDPGCGVPQGGGQPQGAYGQQQGNNAGYNPNNGNMNNSGKKGAPVNNAKSGVTVSCSGQYQPVKPSENINSEQYQMKYVYCLRGVEVGEINYCQGEYLEESTNTIVNCSGQ